MNAPHTDKVAASIKLIRQFREPLFTKLRAVATADGGNLFPFDIIVQLVGKRSLSTAAAFASLVEQHNMISARVLLRVQLDSVMRLHAFTLVAQPHEVAKEVLSGTHLKKCKSRDGKPLRDAYLVAELGKSIEWFPRVYDRTSGFVHLSESVIGFTVIPSDGGTFTTLTSEVDDMPEESWLETADCFIETSKLVLHYMESWAQQKEQVGKSRPTKA